MPSVLTPPSVRARSRVVASLVAAAASLAPLPAAAQMAGAVSVPPDSSRWIFEGTAGVGEYLGRRCVMLDGGAATVRDVDLRDGVIDMDVGTSAKRGFFGIQFRTDSVNGEYV